MFTVRTRRQSPIPLIALVVVLVGMLAFAACGAASTSVVGTPTAPTSPLIATDALGQPIVIPAAAPQKIISLEPSNSEILAALGVTSRVIGVDQYTDYPAEMAAKTKVTSGFTANVEQILALKPDLVLDYSAFFKDADQKLAQAGIQIVSLPTPNLEQTLTEIRLVGQLVHAYAAADTLATSMQQRIDTVKQKARGASPVTVYAESDYSIAGSPYVDGGGSIPDEMIRYAGGTNIFGGNTQGNGYPQVSDEAIIAANPQIILLGDGLDPATVSARPGWSSISAVKNGKIYAIDPNLISRPGPRIVDALDLVAKDVHPDLFS